MKGSTPQMSPLNQMGVFWFSGCRGSLYETNPSNALLLREIPGKLRATFALKFVAPEKRNESHLLMEEILLQLIWYISLYLHGFIHPNGGWEWDFWTINSLLLCSCQRQVSMNSTTTPVCQKAENCDPKSHDQLLALPLLMSYILAKRRLKINHFSATEKKQ